MKICNDIAETPKNIKSNNKLCNNLLNLKKIKALNFFDGIDIPFYDISDFVRMDESSLCQARAYSDTMFFMYKFGKINNCQPFMFYFQDVNVNKFINNLFKHYDVPKNAYHKSTDHYRKTPDIMYYYVAFAKDLYIGFSAQGGVLYYNKQYEDDKNSLLYKILGLIKTCKIPDAEKNKIWIVYRNTHGFDKVGFDIKKVKVDLDLNYNDGFYNVSQKIIKGLNSRKKTNLVILSGVIGSGKTYYLRHLTSKLKKHIIFIPPDMVNSITDPSFIPFLMENNNSILVIEDAEPALEKRGTGGRNGAISNVLNLTDGLLSDCLNISIIATFNVTTKNIDEALLRKGRLLQHYHFDKLSIEKTKALLKKLGHDVDDIKEPMSLADIYYYGENNNGNGQQTKKIGYK